MDKSCALDYSVGYTAEHTIHWANSQGTGPTDEKAQRGSDIWNAA